MNGLLDAQRAEAATSAIAAQEKWDRERTQLQRQLEEALSKAQSTPVPDRTAEIEQLTSENRRKTGEIETLQQRVTAQDQELAELRKQLSEASSAAAEPAGARMTPDDIKKIMSDIFGCISDAVDAMEEFNADTVMDQVKRVLRDVTKRTLAEL